MPVESRSVVKNEGRNHPEAHRFVQDTKDTQEDANVSKDTGNAQKDTTTVITYSVMIWYTPEFRNTFFTEADMEAFVNLVIEETNQGYINSQIPVCPLHIHMLHHTQFQVRAEKFDVKEHPSLHDNYNSSAMLEDFDSSLPPWQLFNCADAVALLIDDFDRWDHIHCQYLSQL